MIRTSANTDVEKTSDYRCRGNICPFLFAGTDLPTQFNFVVQFGKNAFNKVWLYFS